MNMYGKNVVKGKQNLLHSNPWQRCL